MHLTDIFIKRPVLASVVSLLILVLGARSLSLLPVRQFPYTENAIVTVSTTYTGADPSIIAGFITTPLENSIAQANGIDYITSGSTQNQSTITVYLRLNYNPQIALADINTKVNAVLNQLPPGTQRPVISVQIGETIDAMYIGFYSDVLEPNQITDYILRNIQPRLQALDGVQQAEIRGERDFAMRIWLDPVKLSGFGLTTQDISNALANNDVITAAGRTDGRMFTVNLAATTNLTSVSGFRNMVIKAQNGAIVRLKDVANVTLGSTNYDTAVSFNGKQAIYVGILLTPSANLLNVIQSIKDLLPDIQHQLPEGLQAKIVYDSTEFVNSSIHEVLVSLLEALVIVIGVIFLFLGSYRSVIIPVITIPLSLTGTFLLMLLLGYSINLLTLLALVLAIGLVVDDAIIVVENIQRHIEEGYSKIEAALLGAAELINPIIAITLVLLAVYIPIGFMKGLTGALFTEFAFTLAGTVFISAVVALTLSPMMCSRLLYSREEHLMIRHAFVDWLDRQFERLKVNYKILLHEALNALPVIQVFSLIIFVSIYFLYNTSKSELAPQEDQGVIISQLTASPNATLEQTQFFSNQVNAVYQSFPETERIFQLDGINGLNTSMIGMGLKPWDKRSRTTNQLQPLLQQKLDQISGGIIAAFQLPPLPGARGVPVQFVINSTDPFERMNEVNQQFVAKARESGQFIFLDTDLKIDKAQTSIVLNRDKLAELGLTMTDVGNFLSGALSQAYINYFDFSGRSYQVIPQMQRNDRQNFSQLQHYYIKTASNTVVPFATVAEFKTKVLPESLNHFQQLNSATLSGVPFPGITMGDALNTLKGIALETLPQGYTIDYAGQSRQYVQESNAFFSLFAFAMTIIYLALCALFESFVDPLIILISVPMSICGALIFISLSIGGSSLNIYTEVGLITLIGLISKHGILIVQFANELRKRGLARREAIETAASIRLRPILMTTAAMVLGVIPLIFASGAGAVSRFNIGLVIGSGIAIGTLFTLFVVPAMYLSVGKEPEADES